MSEAERRAKERWYAYMRGWYDGAGVKAIREEMSEHPRTGVDYLEGYRDGRAAGKKVAEEAAAHLGCRAIVLKIATTDRDAAVRALRDQETRLAGELRECWRRLRAHGATLRQVFFEGDEEEGGDGIKRLLDRMPDAGTDEDFARDSRPSPADPEGVALRGARKGGEGR